MLFKLYGFEVSIRSSQLIYLMQDLVISEVNDMKYNQFIEDLHAISALLYVGKIDSEEAHEMREYVESLAV